MDILERKDYFFQLIAEHIIISSFAISITAIIGIILGVLVFYSSKSRIFILPIVNFLYTIPSIAMFGLLIPLVGIGLNNALIVLILYGLLPMVRNSYTGFKEVRPDLVEAAKGMGATPFQIFKDVYFPLALPSILAGLRVTTVMLIALTGLAALIGAGGLGQAIFRGLNTMNTSMIVAGSLAISLFAIIGDKFVGVIEENLQRIITKNASKKQKIKVTTIAVLSLFFILASIIYTNPLSQKRVDEIIVASKPSTEQFILAEIVSQLIEHESDLKVIKKLGIGGGTTNIHPAMINKEIDIYVEYTGTAWMNVLKFTLPKDKQVKLNDINREYNENFSFSWIALLGFNNTYSLAIPDSLAKKYSISSFSDLAIHSDEFIFGAEFDFFERIDGYDTLVKTYNFNFASINEMDINLRYNALFEAKVNAIDAFTTDAKIAEYNLVVLEDDKNYFPKYEAGIVVRNEILEKYKALKPLLEKLNSKITNEKMIDLNYQVEIQGKDPEEVAAEFVRSILNDE